MIEGWQPHSWRGRRGNGRWSGGEMCTSVWIVGKKRGECQLKRRKEIKEQEWNRSTEKVEREGNSNRPDVLNLHTRSAVQGVRAEKMFILIYRFHWLRNDPSYQTLCQFHIQNRMLFIQFLEIWCKNQSSAWIFYPGGQVSPMPALHTAWVSFWR